MRVAIHQPHYLPWLRYVEKIARADIFILLDTVQYTRNGWQNRNRIKSATGPLMLTVPVQSRFGEPIESVCTAESTHWRRKHLRALEQNYGRAPYFAEHWSFFVKTYEREWPLLAPLNRHMIEYIVAGLGIATRIVAASELGVNGIATDRLVNLVQAVGGDTYYSGAYALEQYLDAEAFTRAGIRLELQDWRAPTYRQEFGAFVPDLSVVDLLFNCGARGGAMLLERAVSINAADGRRAVT